MKRGLVLSLSAVLVAVPAASAKTDAGPAAEKRPLGYTLADKVLSTKKLARSVKATQQVLALSGVATVSEGQEIVPAVAPLSRWRTTARETVLLTIGARNPQVTLGSIAKRLSEAGVEMDGRPAKDAFPDMVRDWLYVAAARPDEPLSQPAQFIWRMQSRQASRTPFDQRVEEPEKMVLSSLEGRLVLANLERVIKPGTPPEELEPAPGNEEPPPDEPYYDGEPVAAAATEGGPCASVKSAFDSLGPIASGAADVVIDEATGSAIEAYADSLKNGAGDKVGKVLTGLDIADRLWRTYAFSQHVNVNVFLADGDGPLKGNRVHKPTDGSRKHVFYVADVGLNEEKRKELEEQLKLAKDHAFQESMRACAALHGISIPKAPYGDLAKEMEDWKAYWTALWNTQEVRWYHPRRSTLKRIDFASAGSLFKVGVIWEDRKIHRDKQAYQYVSDWNAKVEISAQKPPSLVNIAKLSAAIATGGQLGEFADPIAELMEGMFRTIAKPTATGTLTVEEHMKSPCPLPRSAAHASC